MWNGTSKKSCGTANLLVTNPATNKKHRINFDLVAGNHKPILGVVDVLRLNLVHINLDNFERVLAVNHKPKQTTKGEILKQYEAVFSDKLGTLEGDAHLSINESITPVILPARNIPVSLHPHVKVELDRMVDLGVISPTDEPTDWVSQVVVVERKNTDRIRICIDPRPLNKALQREHYHLPTLDEVLPELGKAKVYAKFDLRCGYWHVPLDKPSRRSPAANTLWEIHLESPPIWSQGLSRTLQKRVHAAIADLPGIYCITDDVLIAGIGDDLPTARASLDYNINCFLKTLC